VAGLTDGWPSALYKSDGIRYIGMVMLPTTGGAMSARFTDCETSVLGRPNVEARLDS
jgi:hypothetical protein